MWVFYLRFWVIFLFPIPHRILRTYVFFLARNSPWKSNHSCRVHLPRYTININQRQVNIPSWHLWVIPKPDLFRAFLRAMLWSKRPPMWGGHFATSGFLNRDVIDPFPDTRCVVDLPTFMVSSGGKCIGKYALQWVFGISFQPFVRYLDLVAINSRPDIRPFFFFKQR